MVVWRAVPLLPACLIEPLWVEFAALIGATSAREFAPTHGSISPTSTPFIFDLAPGAGHDGGAQVDDPVGVRHHRSVVLDDVRRRLKTFRRE